MRTPKALYQSRAVVYTCELECCPVCGGVLVECGYQSAFKTVWMLGEAVRIAQRPKQCISVGCQAQRVLLRSACWQQTAPLGCSYGYDVIGQIGWQRQERHEQFAAIHAGLAKQVPISESEVRYLHHYQYLPLLACNERQEEPRIEEAAAEYGLLLALDGLSPEGGEPQLWIVRELRTGLALRSGWLSQQDTKAFANFLQPIAEKQWRILAVLSDKQGGLEQAVGQVFPDAKHAFCQIHYLNNAAEPLEEASEVMKVALRKSVRHSVGELIRAERVADAAGVLTVTGVIPSPLPGVDEAEAKTIAGEATGSAEAAPAAETATGVSATGMERESIVQGILGRVRYLLTLKSRRPFGLAGIEMFARLSEVAECLDQLVAHDPEPRLVQLREALRQGLNAGRQDYEELRRAADWLEQIAAVLDPESKPVRTGEQVRQELENCLAGIREESKASERLGGFYAKMRKVTTNYSPGLFHTYDVVGLPRTNNGCESDFRDLTRHLLCATGQKGLTQRLIQREGAWGLLGHPPTAKDAAAAISRVAAGPLHEEQRRMRSHRQRFRPQVRSPKRSAAHLADLTSCWLAMPARRVA